MSDQQQPFTPRQRAEQLARNVKYGAWDPGVAAIEAAIAQERQTTCAAFMDAWIANVGSRIPVDDLSPETLAAEYAATARERDVYLGLLDLHMADLSLGGPDGNS